MNYNGHLGIITYLVERAQISDVAKDRSKDRSKVRWTRTNHTDFSASTNKLFGTLFLGIQRLEETGVVPLAHQAMLEDILEGWSGEDDVGGDCEGDCETLRWASRVGHLELINYLVNLVSPA